MAKSENHFLGEFERLVLLALLRLRNNAYGMTIRRIIEERAERTVSIGAVYATLERLEKKGLVSSRKGEATAERGGRAKRYFRIEAPGLRALNEARATDERMWSGLKPAEAR